MISMLSHDTTPLPPARPAEAFTPRLGAAGLRWLFDRRSRWGLSMEELGELLGGINRRTLTEWQRKVRHQEEVDLARDVYERISLLLGIHKALALIAPDGREGLAYEWFKTPTDLMGLQGQSIRDYLLAQGTMDALYYVRRRLDAARG